MKRKPKPRVKKPTRDAATGLKDRRARFVQEYLVEPNATLAAIRAGYSQATAAQAGSELLSFPEVQAAVAEGRKRLAEQTNITSERVLLELFFVAFADHSDVQAMLAKGATLRDLPIAVRRSISEVQRRPDGRITVKQHSKLEALKLIQKQLGFEAPRKNEHSGPGGGAIPFDASAMSPAQMRAEIARIAAEYASATPTSGAQSETSPEAEKIGRDPNV